MKHLVVMLELEEDDPWLLDPPESLTLGAGDELRVARFEGPGFHHLLYGDL